MARSSPHFDVNPQACLFRAYGKPSRVKGRTVRSSATLFREAVAVKDPAVTSRQEGHLVPRLSVPHLQLGVTVPWLATMLHPLPVSCPPVPYFP